MNISPLRRVYGRVWRSQWLPWCLETPRTPIRSRISIEARPSTSISASMWGGYDFEARLLARFMRAHIPGNPVLVPQNMIGAGGIKMANFLYSIAPQDGTAIGMFPNTLIAVQAVGTDGAQYDANRFSWLGSMTTSPLTFTTWHTTGVKT